MFRFASGGSCGTRLPSAPLRQMSAHRSAPAKHLCVGEKGTFTSCPAFFAASSTAAQPPRTIRSASETFFPPDCERLKSVWITSSF